MDIYFIAAGLIDIPDGKEILQIMGEIRTYPLKRPETKENGAALTGHTVYLHRTVL